MGNLFMGPLRWGLRPLKGSHVNRARLWSGRQNGWKPASRVQ